jgi:hypothetical protein
MPARGGCVAELGEGTRTAVGRLRLAADRHTNSTSSSISDEQQLVNAFIISQQHELLLKEPDHQFEQFSSFQASYIVIYYASARTWRRPDPGGCAAGRCARRRHGARRPAAAVDGCAGRAQCALRAWPRLAMARVCSRAARLPHPGMRPRRRAEARCGGGASIRILPGRDYRPDNPWWGGPAAGRLAPGPQPSGARLPRSARRLHRALCSP